MRDDHNRVAHHQQAPILDQESQVSRYAQVKNWIASQLNQSKAPRKLSMRAVRWFLTRRERNRLVTELNQQYASQGLSFRWSGQSNGRLQLRILHIRSKSNQEDGRPNRAQ